MSDTLAQFHFLRPLWLLAIIPVSILVWQLMQSRSRQANWHGAIADSLLQHLSSGQGGTASRWPFYGLWLGLCLAVIGLAGPTWEKLPQPVHQRQDALVIVLDLSLSMLAEDVKPSRLVRARHKVLDILQQRREGLTGLVAYSGDAHIVTPLTDDTPTIANLVPALSPLMMPVIGSDPTGAIELSETLLSSAGISDGRVLLITDGISESDLDAIDDRLQRRGIGLSILGVGTRDGAPIPADKGFLRDEGGNIIVPRLDSQILERLAAENNGRYTTISVNDRDIRFLLPPIRTGFTTDATIGEREYDLWADRGAWICLLLIPFAALAFRRGWILTLVLPLLLLPEPAMAFEWQDLWRRPDQRAQQQLQSGDAKSAAATFEDPAWKGSAYYRAEDYQAAADQFANIDNASAHFNRGNALAKSGQLEAAIAAYDKALEQDPTMDDAAFNRDLVQALLDRQSQQENSDDSQGSQDKQQSSKDNDQQQNQRGQDQQQADASQGDSESGSQSDSQSGNNHSKSSQQSAAHRESQQETDNTASANRDQQRADQGQEQQSRQQEPEQEQGEQGQVMAQEASTSDDAEETDQAMQAQTAQQSQATEQWLRQIPDDPAGLLRRKFNYESQVRQQQGESQREQPRW